MLQFSEHAQVLDRDGKQMVPTGERAWRGLEDCTALEVARGQLVVRVIGQSAGARDIELAAPATVTASLLQKEEVATGRLGDAWRAVTSIFSPHYRDALSRGYSGGARTFAELLRGEVLHDPDGYELNLTVLQLDGLASIALATNNARRASVSGVTIREGVLTIPAGVLAPGAAYQWTAQWPDESGELKLSGVIRVLSQADQTRFEERLRDELKDVQAGSPEYLLRKAAFLWETELRFDAARTTAEWISTQDRPN
jgi:hypothetical protein